MIPKQPTSILNGPSKFDLMLALFDRAGASPRSVYFTLHSDEQAEVVVTGVEAESGSGEEWLFKGYRRLRTQDVAAPQNVVGFYSTQHRKGWVQLSV